MINWEKIKRIARARIADADDDSPELEKLQKIIKYCKFREDRNIYSSEEIITYWDERERAQYSTKTIITAQTAQNFRDYCSGGKHTIKKEYIFK